MRRDPTGGGVRRGLRRHLLVLLAATVALLTAAPAVAGAEGSAPWWEDRGSTTTTAAPDTTVTTAAPTTTAPTATTEAPAPTATAPTPALALPGPAAAPAESPSTPAAASITVTPSTDLVQGDTVTVSGSGFPANVMLGVIQCIPGTGVESCSMSTLVYANTDASGNFSKSFVPRRILRIAGVDHDCSDLGACRIGSGTVPDGSGGSASADIRFDPAVPPPPPPTVTVTPDTNLLDKESVLVTGENFLPNVTVPVIQCATPPTPSGSSCNTRNLTWIMTSNTGTFTVSFTVRRLLYVGGVPTDCAVAGACIIGVGSEEDGDTAPIQFDPSQPLPPAPTLTVTPDTDLLDGQTVAVTGTGFDTADHYVVAQCPTGQDLSNGCSSTGSFEVIQPDGSGDIDTSLVVDRLLYDYDGTRVDCADADACRIVVFDLDQGWSPASAPIQFDPNAPLPPPPSITLDPATGVRDGQLVTVTGSGFPRRATVGIVQCRAGSSSQQDCDLNHLTYVSPNSDGSFSVPFAAARFITVGGQTIDCAEAGACEIGAGSLPLGQPGTATPIQFSADPPVGPTTTTTAGAGGDEVAPSFTG